MIMGGTFYSQIPGYAIAIVMKTHHEQEGNFVLLHCSQNSLEVEFRHDNNSIASKSAGVRDDEETIDVTKRKHTQAGLGFDAELLS